MKRITITIEGMHCAACAGNVEKSVGKVSGVDSVNVNVMVRKGFIEAEGNVDLGAIKKAVSKVGYKVINVEEE